MGTIYKVNNKWRVQIKRKGFSPISGYFLDYDKAKAFHDKIEDKIQKLRDDLKLDEAFEKIQSR